MSVGKKDNVNLGKENQLEEPYCPPMEKVENKFLGEKDGEASSMGFSRETQVPIEDNKGTAVAYRCSTKKHKLEASTIQGFETQRKDKARERRRLNRQERIELGRKFQEAVSTFDWDVARRLIMGVDTQILNDALCIALDSIWFLSTRQELNGISQLINFIISNGAHDFTRAVLRTSFLASCVSACKSSKMSSSDTQAIMAHR